MSLPVQWRTTRLNEVADVKYGKPKPAADGDVPVVGSGGIYGYTSEALVSRPTLVVGRKGTAGMVWLMEEGCWPADTTFYLDWTADIDIFYIYSQMMAHPLSGQHARTTMPSLKRPELENYPLVLPPLPEQRAAASAFRRVQEARDTRLREIELEREHKAALMDYLFRYGTRNEPTRQTENGEIPESWRVVSLDEVADIQYGIQAAVANSRDASAGVPILTNINITNDGILDLTTLRYWPVPEGKQDRLLLKKGDLLFNWRSGSQSHVGKTALFDREGEYTYSSFILRFRTEQAVHNIFLLYYLQCLKQRGFFAQNRQQSSVNSVFNASVAAKIPVVLPSHDEQSSIAEVLCACDARITALEREAEVLDELFKAVLEELMTGRLSAIPLVEPEEEQ